MKPKVEIFPEKDFKGTSKFYNEGTFDNKESFTQNDLVGRTFYIILTQTKNGTKYALDKSGTDTTGGKYHLWTWSKDNLNQIFTMTPNGTIKNIKNDLAMDVINGTFKDGNGIQNYPSNNTDAQLWTYDSNTRMVRLKNKPYTLNLHNNEVKDGGTINIWTPNGSVSQMWSIQLCDIKDNFGLGERFALRFYNPVPSFNGKTEQFNSRFHDPVPSLNDAHVPKSLEEQKESFTTCRAILYQDIDKGGSNTGWVDIGDYNFDGYFKNGYKKGGYAKNDDVSSVELRPFTDIILYEHADFKGKVLSIHNGTTLTRKYNLTDHDFNDKVSSYKVRAGAIDDRSMTKVVDISGNSVCNIRYRVYMAKSGWSNWVESGKEAGKAGDRMEAIEFHYSGPGQLYARAHVAEKGWLNWVSSDEICGTTGKSLRLEALEFKVEGLSGLYFGLDTYVQGKGWTSQVGLNKVGGTTGQSKQLEIIKLTTSLKAITATSTTGKTITLLDFPKKWVITDLSIGKFDKLVGKRFIIKSRKNAKFVLDTGGLQNGRGTIKIYERSAEPHVNQVWSVDKQGRLYPWENKNTVLYIPNTQNSTKPEMVIPGKDSKSNLACWRLNDKNQICSIEQPNQVLDVSGGTMKNNTPVIIYANNGGKNQIWDIEEIKDDEHNVGEFKKWIGKTFMIYSKLCGESSKLVIHSRNVQKGKGGDAGKDVITLWASDSGNMANMKWTVNDKGQITLATDQQWGIYASSTKNSTKIQLKKLSSIKSTDKGQYWSLDSKGVISSELNKKKVIDVSGGEENCKKGGTVILYDTNNGNNQRWILKEYSEPKKLSNDIKSFKSFVGKTIIIQPESDGSYFLHSRNVQKGKGGDAGKDMIGLWTSDSAKANREWEIDSDGHILLSSDKEWCVYAQNSGTDKPLILAKTSSLDKFDLKQYWSFDGSVIKNLGINAKLTIISSNITKGSTLCVDDKHNTKYQKWKVQAAPTESTTQKTTQTSKATKINSIKVNPLTDVIFYEDELDKNKMVRRLEIHNGRRNEIYEIRDLSIYGLSISKFEVKTAKEDSNKTAEVITYEPFKMFHKDGRLNCNGMIIFTILITLCVFCFVMHHYNTGYYPRYHRDSYINEDGWWLMNGRGRKY